MLLSLLAAAISIHADFEGGSMGKVERVAETHYKVALTGDKDQDGRNRQANWYYFRVDGVKAGQPVTIDLVDLPGEYNYKPNRGAVRKETPSVVSHDNKTWEHVTTFEYDAVQPKMRLVITPKSSRFWIAHVPPYTNTSLASLERRLAKSAAFSSQIIGKSVEGRELYLWTIAASAKPAKTVWLMFRQHSWETGSSYAGEGAVLELLANESLRRNVTWKIFPLCDPDGVAHGNVRFNKYGFDLNRNWDVEDPARMPEITAQRNAVRKWIDGGNSIDLYFSLHNTETGEYLEGPPHSGEFEKLATRFFGLLKEKSTFDPTRPLFFATPTTTEGMKGRMNVAQGLYKDFKIPTFLMEQRISFNQKFKRLPLPADRLQFGAELVRAMHEAVQ